MRAAVILAGGKGVRIGGNKHLRKLHGKPLVLHVVENASLVAQEILVVLKNEDDPKSYREMLPRNVRIVTDEKKSDAPLVGIMTGARAASSEYSAFLSCDLAFLNAEALKYLFDQAESLDAIIPRWPDGRFEPLHAVYSTKKAGAAAEDALKASDYRNISIAKRMRNVRFVPVDELRRFDPELLTFFNVNTTEELAKAESLMMRKD